ncbi:MAG: hypothetical protein ACTSVU_08135 [Promethearchaeota archaeon]
MSFNQHNRFNHLQIKLELRRILLLCLISVALLNSCNESRALTPIPSKQSVEYSVIVDQMAGSIFSQEPFNVIRLNGSVILSSNAIKNYFDFNYNSPPFPIYFDPYSSGFGSVEGFFYGEVSLINATITKMHIPPIIPNNGGITYIPQEIANMYDNPVNDSVWKFMARPYYNNRSTRDEMLLINDTTCKLLSNTNFDYADRVKLSIHILAHPAYIVIKLLHDENGLESTINYFSVGADREKYYSGERIPLTKLNNSKTIGTSGDQPFQPDYMNFLFQSPSPILFELALSSALPLTLPLSLFYVLRNKNARASFNSNLKPNKAKHNNDELLKRAITKNTSHL